VKDQAWFPLDSRVFYVRSLTLSLAEVGLHTRLLCMAWQEERELERGRIVHAIPRDTKVLARVANVQRRVFNRSWPGVSALWQPVGAGELYCPTFEEMLAAGTRRQPIPDSLKVAVLERDGRVCGICQQPIGESEIVHIDHIYPVSRGGGNRLSNLQPAHAVCNLSKGARV
jgi:hypothetical protein